MPRSTTSANQSIDALAHLWKSVVALMHQRSAGDTLSVMNDVGLTLPQMVTLFALRSRGPHSVCDIADRLKLSRAATSHMVDRLVQSEMVERQEDADDRRQKRVTITPKARTLLAKLDESRTQEFTAIVRSLSPDLRLAFSEVLTRVMAELQGAEPTPVLRCQTTAAETPAHALRPEGSHS